jgi:glycosyltransferase involved in cell wall biosynthesis
VRVIELTNDFSFGNGRAVVINEVASNLRKNTDVEIWYNYCVKKTPETEAKLVKIKSSSELFKKLLKEKNTIIHSHFGKNQLIAALARVFNKNIRHVVTDHVNPPRKISRASFFNYWKVEFFYKLLYHLGVDEIAGISKYCCNLIMKNYHVNKKKIHLIYDGIDTSRYRVLKKKSSKTIVVGCFSRFSPSKNIHSLIKIAKDFPENTVLMLAGATEKDPKYFEFCKKIAGNSLKIRFFTNLNEKDKIKFINSIDIFVYPSLWEGFGLPIVEAMACGKPVIVFNRYAMPELVKTSYNGFAVDNEKELLSKVSLLCKDKKMQEEMGKNSLKKSKEFDWEIIAGKYRKLFENLRI